jgi:hypothetical protein
MGLDGSTEFVAMARAYSECEVLQQDFLAASPSATPGLATGLVVA